MLVVSPNILRRIAHGDGEGRERQTPEKRVSLTQS